MYRFLYKLYFHKFRIERIDATWYHRLQWLSNEILPDWFKRTAGSDRLPENQGAKPKLIVSLTTFPARIEYVWLAIETILRQERPADKVILWLYEGEFEGKASLPENLLQLEERGLEIRFCKENLMPHKKYLYTMTEYPEADVITVDDDMFFPSDLISRLCAYQERFKRAIICTRTREISVSHGKIKPYLEWPNFKENAAPSFKYLTMGGGGTYFPAGCLHPDAFDVEAIKSHALRADDLWLKVMSLRNNTPVASMAGEYPRFFMNVQVENDIRLMDANVGSGNNDKVFQHLLEEYHIDASSFNDGK